MFRKLVYSVTYSVCLKLTVLHRPAALFRRIYAPALQQGTRLLVQGQMLDHFEQIH